MDKVIPFKPGHLDLMEIREVFAHDKTLIERCETQYNAHGSFSYTLVKNWKPIAIIGMDLKWPGVGEVWAVTSDDVVNFPKFFHQHSDRMMNAYAKELKLWRLQATVRDGFEYGMNWMKGLKFEREALLKKFGPEGSDYVLFARMY